jgi:hypothetical protein
MSPRIVSKGLAAALLLALAAPVSAELPVAPLTDIYESYNDCFKIATRQGLDPQQLAGLGWQRATSTDKDGKPTAAGPVIYGHAKRKAVMFFTAEKLGLVCTIVARLQNVAAFDQFKKAWGGKLPAPDKDGIIGFMVNGQPVALRRAGTPDKPTLSISVMTPPTPTPTTPATTEKK